MSEERTNYAATPQPKPISGDGSALVLPHVLADLQARADWGLAKYQTYLRTHNGRDAMVDLYQELLDAVMYVKQVMLERETVDDQLARLRSLVISILDNWRNMDPPKDQPVNWADVTCEFVCLTVNWRGERGWLVVVDEAAPDASQFQNWLAAKLSEAGWHPVVVMTEW